MLRGSAVGWKSRRTRLTLKTGKCFCFTSYRGMGGYLMASNTLVEYLLLSTWLVCEICHHNREFTEWVQLVVKMSHSGILRSNFTRGRGFRFQGKGSMGSISDLSSSKAECGGAFAVYCSTMLQAEKTT